MLFNENVLDANYDFCYEPNVVGIATIIKNNKKRYFVYETTERCNVYCMIEQKSFATALSYAKRLYKNLMAYYNRKIKNNNAKKAGKKHIKTNKTK